MRLRRSIGLSDAFELLGRNQHFRCHAWNVGTFGVFEVHFEHDGADVALAAADVTLSSEIGFRGLEKYFSGSDGSAGQTDAQSVSQTDVIGFGLGNGGTDPGVTQINDS